MWSMMIHEVGIFYKAYTTLHLYPTATEKDFNKFKQKRDHLSKKRESNTVRKSESFTGLERSDCWSSTGGNSK